MEQWYYEISGRRAGPVSETALKDLARSGHITNDSLIWKSEFGREWKSYAEAFPLEEGSPPPLPTTSINNIYAWMIAILPIVGSVIDSILTVSGVDLNDNSSAVLLVWFLAYSILTILDSRQIENSGRNTRHLSVGKWFWLVPAFLFQRARATAQSKRHLYVWIIAFIASIFIENPNILQEPTYFGSGIPSCDSSFEVGEVKKIFAEIPQIEDQSLIASTVSNISTSYSSGDGNTCAATVIGSDQNSYEVKYTIRKDNNQFFTHLELAQ